MNNLELPAHPTEVQWSEGRIGKLHQNGNATYLTYGFTKLEKASLMIAANMSAQIYSDGMTDQQLDHIKRSSVAVAKAVLEEANK